MACKCGCSPHFTAERHSFWNADVLSNAPINTAVAYPLCIYGFVYAIKREIIRKGKKIKTERFALSVSCFIYFKAPDHQNLLWLGLSLTRSMMVKMAQLRSLAHTRACRCKVSSSPAPLTIFGWNFPLTRRQQQQDSGSHTTVSHISLLWGGRRTLKLFQMSEFALASGAKHFM